MMIDDVVKEIEKNTGRQIVFAALRGSRNYGLETPESDYDYAVFVMPTHRELYDGELNYTKEVKGNIRGDLYEATIYDIRRLPRLASEMNPAFIEIFKSKSNYYRNLDILVGLSSLTNRLVHANLTKLYYSSLGVIKYERTHMYKGKYTGLTGEYEYDWKKAMHAYRFMYILLNYGPDVDLEDVLRPPTHVNDIMRHIRAGAYNREDIETLLDLLAKDVEKRKDIFTSAPIDNDAFTELNETIYNKLFCDHSLP